MRTTILIVAVAIVGALSSGEIAWSQGFGGGYGGGTGGNSGPMGGGMGGISGGTGVNGFGSSMGGTGGMGYGSMSGMGSSSAFGQRTVGNGVGISGGTGANAFGSGRGPALATFRMSDKPVREAYPGHSQDRMGVLSASFPANSRMAWGA